MDDQVRHHLSALRALATKIPAERTDVAFALLEALDRTYMVRAAEPEAGGSSGPTQPHAGQASVKCPACGHALTIAVS